MGQSTSGSSDGILTGLWQNFVTCAPALVTPHRATGSHCCTVAPANLSSTLATLFLPLAWMMCPHAQRAGTTAQQQPSSTTAAAVPPQSV